MFGNNNFDLVRKMFADQFEQDGDRYLYRRYQRAAPIQVSAAERESFIAQFNRRLRYLSWCFIGALVLLLAAVVALVMMDDLPVTMVGLIWIPLVALTAALIGLQYWFWDQPTRDLSGRLPVGPGRSPAEMKRVTMRKMTWTRIGGIAAVSLVAVFRIDWSRGLLSGSNLAWICLAGFVLLAAGVTALQKLRYERGEANLPE